MLWKLNVPLPIEVRSNDNSSHEVIVGIFRIHEVGEQTLRG